MPWTLSHVDAAPPPRGRFRFRPALLDAFRGYTALRFTRDVQAGLVVGVVALPLAIAFAIASGADPRAGLVTAVVAGTLVALLGGTRTGVAGPTSSFVVILYAIVERHGGRTEPLLLAVFLAGGILVVAGLLRLGPLLKLIPHPVTTGFTAGIAVSMLLGQVPDLFGLQLSLPSHTIERVQALAAHAGEANLTALGLGVAAVLVIQLGKRWIPAVPGPILALVGLTAFAHFAALDLPTVGGRYSIPAGLGAPHMVGFSWDLLKDALPDAFAIAFLCAIESLSTAVVADGMTGTRHDSDQELVGQGIANMVSPLFGGLAGVGALARTATNIQAGATTPVASLTHATLVLLVLFVAAPLVGLIPMAVLAGILVVVAWNISQRRHVARIFRMPRADAAVMTATFLLTLFLDLASAIVVGLLLSAAIFLQRMGDMAHVELVDPAHDVHPEGHAVRAEDVPDGVRIYSIDGPFFFAGADRFQETMARVARPPKVLILRMRAVPYMDATGLHALEQAIHGLRKQGTRVLLAGIQSQPLDLMERSGAVHVVGDQNLFRDIVGALAEARRHLGLPPAPAPAPS